MNHEFSIDGLFDFLNAGVSAFHSTAAAAAILEENGYQNCPESAAWQSLVTVPLSAAVSRAAIRGQGSVRLNDVLRQAD